MIVLFIVTAVRTANPANPTFGASFSGEGTRGCRKYFHCSGIELETTIERGPLSICI
jgi:hypothetical protein